jgi:ribonuclease P protein component
MDFSFHKKERLCSKYIIEKLFNEGKVVYEYPFKAFWLQIDLPEKVPVQTVINVSKKRFKRAVKRNLLKRRMREAFRLNNYNFYSKIDSQQKQFALMILYNNNTILDFNSIQLGMIKLLDRILLKIESTN